jgi:hypothetical protein
MNVFSSNVLTPQKNNVRRDGRHGILNEMVVVVFVIFIVIDIVIAIWIVDLIQSEG